MSNQKGFSQLVLLAILAIVIISIVGYFYSKKQSSEPKPHDVVSLSSPSPSFSQPVVSPHISSVTENSYTNKKYGYFLIYPSSLPIYNGDATSKDEELKELDMVGSLNFGCSGFGIGVCNPQFRIGKTILNKDELSKISALKEGDKTDQSLTYTIGGKWNQKTDYKKLPDENANGVNFLVLDNYSGYGGSSKIWFLKIKDEFLQFSCIYSDYIMISDCQDIIDSVKLTSNPPVTMNTNGFPVYPDATFIGIKDYPPCEEGKYSGFSICNARTYKWKVKATNSSLADFYGEDKTNTGWKCSGGAGSIEDENNASGVTGCKKGDLRYDLFKSIVNGYSTITLAIPKGTPTGK